LEITHQQYSRSTTMAVPMEGKEGNTGKRNQSNLTVLNVCACYNKGGQGANTHLCFDMFAACCRRPIALHFWDHDGTSPIFFLKNRLRLVNSIF